MKTMTFSLILVFLFTTTSIISQWSTDPENPGLVCDLTGTQNNVCSFSDEAGGAYVFWLDARNNPGNPAKEIYGQHYDSEGYEMWEPDGRYITAHYNHILAFDIKRGSNGNMILGMITKSIEAGSGDTLRFNMMDASGEPVWDNELVVSKSGITPNSILYITSFMLLPVEEAYYVLLEVTYYGGANGNRFTRFDSDRNLVGVFDGVPVGNQGYVGVTRCATTYDDSNDFYLYYATGNGSGADLHAFRFNSSGSLVWGPVDVTDGTSGLSYQMNGVSDPNGITFVWQGNSGGSVNLMSRRLSPSGSPLWGGEVLNVCAADGSQTNFHLKRKDMYIFITWADGRPGTDPGNYDIYAQKMDTTGYFYWAPDGNQIASFNTYIPHPMLEITEDYSIFVNHQSTQAGFMAQLVAPDGTLPWGPEARQISVKAFNPFYQLHNIFQSDASTIAVWNKSASGGGSDGVYITRIDLLTGLGEQETEAEMTISPNPVADRLQLQFPLNMHVRKIQLCNPAGQIVEEREISETEGQGSMILSTAHLSPGPYFLRVISDQKTIVQKMVVR